jgi:hypothetical protein
MLRGRLSLAWASSYLSYPATYLAVHKDDTLDDLSDLYSIIVHMVSKTTVTGWAAALA